MTDVHAHVLVCRGPDCMSRGAQAVYTAMSVALAVADDPGVVQTQCGCVAPLCGRGPVVLAYPSGAWYAGVAASDCPEIVASDVVAGRALRRLQAAAVNREAPA